MSAMIAEKNIDENVTEECFPREKKQSGSKAMVLIAFKGPVTSDKAIARLVDEQLRPATLRELLAFIIQAGVSKLTASTIVLQSKCKIPGTDLEYVPVLRVKRDKKDPDKVTMKVEVVHYGAIWGKDCQFLATPRMAGDL